MGAWLISVPTVASTNATATFSASIEGDADRNVWYVGPHTVIADTRIIAQGGGRWLAAGMADALPTWTGGRIGRELRLRSGTERILGFDNVFPTGAAVAIAEWTYDTILGYGESAYHACERGAATEAVDKVVEAIVYGGGVAGPACGGVGGEHGVHPGKSRHATIERVHGEEVAFGVLVAVALMQQGEAEVRKLIRFNQSVKLPSTFADFGVQNATRSLVTRDCGRNPRAGRHEHLRPLVRRGRGPAHRRDGGRGPHGARGAGPVAGDLGYLVPVAFQERERQFVGVGWGLVPHRVGSRIGGCEIQVFGAADRSAI